jgi:hypothetical protein
MLQLVALIILIPVRVCMLVLIPFFIVDYLLSRQIRKIDSVSVSSFLSNTLGACMYPVRFLFRKFAVASLWISETLSPVGDVL